MECLRMVRAPFNSNSNRASTPWAPSQPRHGARTALRWQMLLSRTLLLVVGSGRHTEHLRQRRDSLSPGREPRLELDGLRWIGRRPQRPPRVSGARCETLR